ncbi:hypothetical protein MMC16_001195 [Acarospora aff. strigata]|nr:hypothetical protein [Acarospora aff. strigata]
MPSQQASSSAAAMNAAPLSLLLTVLFMVILATCTPSPAPSPVEGSENVYRGSYFDSSSSHNPFEAQRPSASDPDIVDAPWEAAAAVGMGYSQNKF